MEWHHYTSLQGLESILSSEEIISITEMMRDQLNIEYKENPEEAEERFQKVMDAYEERYPEKELRRRTYCYLINEKRAVDCASDQVLITIEEKLEPNYGSDMLEVPRIAITMKNIVSVGAQLEFFDKAKKIVEKTKYKKTPVYILY